MRERESSMQACVENRRRGAASNQQVNFEIFLRFSKHSRNSNREKKNKQSVNKHQLEVENANECKVVGGANETMADLFLFIFSVVIMR